MRAGFTLWVVLTLTVTLTPLTAGAAETEAVRFAAASIRQDDLQKHVETLAADIFEGRAAGSRGGQAAAGYVVRALQQLHLRPAGDAGSYFQGFNDGMRNVLAVLEGSDPQLSQQYVVICAHYDHVGYGTPRNSYGPTGFIHNGADDNASGVSAVLEVAEAMCQLPQPPGRSILFALWDGEEAGLLGSKHWMAQPTLPLSQVACAINVDMVGRLREHLEVYGVRSAAGWRTLIARQNHELDLPMSFIWNLEADSDHYSFIQRRIPVIMFHTGLHDDYHRPSDDADLINTAGMERIGRVLFHVGLDLADQSQAPVFREQVFTENDSTRKQLEQPEAVAPTTRLGVQWAARDQQGVELTAVHSGSAAERAGLRTGDVIESLNGRPVDGGFARQILAAPTASQLRVRRGSQEPATVPVALDGKPARLGASWRRDPGNPQAVWVSRITPGSAAQAAGLQVGDRICSAAGQSVEQDATLVGLVSSSATLELEVEREGRLRTVHVELP